MDLREVGQLSEGLGVAQRNVDDAVVGQGAHGVKSSGLLATSKAGSGDEETGVLAGEATGSPDAAGLVPKGLPLGREVTVTGRDAEEEGIVLEQLLGFGNGVVGLGRSVHLAENLVRQGLSDPYPCLSAQKFHGDSGAPASTYWKMSALPPAASMPAFSASASCLMWPYMEYWKMSASVSYSSRRMLGLAELLEGTMEDIRRQLRPWEPW